MLGRGAGGGRKVAQQEAVLASSPTRFFRGLSLPPPGPIGEFLDGVWPLHTCELDCIAPGLVPADGGSRGHRLFRPPARKARGWGKGQGQLGRDGLGQ